MDESYYSLQNIFRIKQFKDNFLYKTKHSHISTDTYNHNPKDLYLSSAAKI